MQSALFEFVPLQLHVVEPPLVRVLCVQFQQWRRVWRPFPFVRRVVLVLGLLGFVSECSRENNV